MIEELNSEAREFLRQRDNLREAYFGNIPCFLHDDHRWVLPLIHVMQQSGALPVPCVWVMFDAHRDDSEPGCKEILVRLRGKGLTLPALFELCDSHLRKLDDDWLKAGMELGLLSDAVIFGAKDTSRATGTFIDHTGVEHRIKFCGYPFDQLGYQGDLSDMARSSALRELWDIFRLGSRKATAIQKRIAKYRVGR